eukprot:UN00789
MSPLRWCLISICYDESLLQNTPTNNSYQPLLQKVTTNVHNEHSPRRASYKLYGICGQIYIISSKRIPSRQGGI